MKHWVIGCLVVWATAVWVGPVLAQAPAVSALNGQAEVLGGEVDGDDALAAAGSVTVPLGEILGLQIDGALGELDNDDEISGIGLHLFTRDPALYLAGFNFSHAELEDFELRRYALEGEYYFGPFTAAGRAGFQEGDVDDAGFVNLDLRWYPLDALMLEIGGSIAEHEELLHLGAEFQAIAGLAVFADLAIGDDDYDHALVGARYYFGQQKPLIRRHREDNLRNNIVNGLLQGLGSFKTPRRAAPAAPAAPAEPAEPTPPVLAG